MGFRDLPQSHVTLRFIELDALFDLELAISLLEIDFIRFVSLHL